MRWTIKLTQVLPGTINYIAAVELGDLTSVTNEEEYMQRLAGNDPNNVLDTFF